MEAYSSYPWAVVSRTITWMVETMSLDPSNLDIEVCAE